MKPKTIKVLDKGFVSLLASHGTEQDVVDSARVSYDKRGVPNADGSLSEKDRGLLNFLAREGHTSPFRHVHLSFEVYTPLMIARQWMKHQVASAYLETGIAYNESSRRYVTENEEFYLPAMSEWRSKPENSKQGSGPNLPFRTNLDEPYSEDIEYGNNWTAFLEWYQTMGASFYENALEAGIAPEQARLFLPANGMYVRFRWTVSLAAVMHFIQLRFAHDSQYEIQQYAKAVAELVEPIYPESYKLLSGVNYGE